MNFLKKTIEKLVQGLNYLFHHKVYLLILIPVIAAVVLGIVLLSRRDSDNPNESSSSDTTAVSTSDTSETETTSVESLPDTLSPSTDDTTASTPEETTAAPEPDIPLFTERTDILGVHIKTDDGIVLMNGEIEVPVFSNRTDAPVINVINESVYDYCEGLRDAIVKKYKPITESDLASESPSVPFSCGVGADVMLSSDTTVSILFLTWIYTGEENNSLYRSAVTYSLIDGSLCTLESLFGESVSDASELIFEKVVAEIAAEPEEFYPDYEGLVEFYDLESHWYLSETGFTVFYVPYELAGYSKGVLTYTIPYGDLNSYLTFNPAYTSSAE